jgi:hypothetical protein
MLCVLVAARIYLTPEVSFVRNFEVFEKFYDLFFIFIRMECMPKVKEMYRNPELTKKSYVILSTNSSGVFKKT